MLTGLSTNLHEIHNIRKTAIINDELKRISVVIAFLREIRRANLGTLKEKDYTFYWKEKSQTSQGCMVKLCSKENSTEHGGSNSSEPTTLPPLSAYISDIVRNTEPPLSAYISDIVRNTEPPLSAYISDIVRNTEPPLSAYISDIVRNTEPPLSAYISDIVRNTERQGRRFMRILFLSLESTLAQNN